jgi:predicted transcriptional regulator
MSKKQKQPGLFDHRPRYPRRPGWKESETSREAALEMEARAGTLRRLALDYIRKHPGHTADEVASALGESAWAIRPRVSELRKLGLVINEGRGRNKSGKGAHLWRAA